MWNWRAWMKIEELWRWTLTLVTDFLPPVRLFKCMHRSGMEKLINGANYILTRFSFSLSWLLSCFFFLSSSRFFIFSLFLLFISMDDCSLESKIKKNKTKKKIGRILMTHGRSDKWHDRFSFRLLPISLLCVICWLLFFLLTQYLSRRCLLWKFSFWLTTTWHQQLKLDYHNSQQFFLW